MYKFSAVLASGLALSFWALDASAQAVRGPEPETPLNQSPSVPLGPTTDLQYTPEQVQDLFNAALPEILGTLATGGLGALTNPKPAPPPPNPPALAILPQQPLPTTIGGITVGTAVVGGIAAAVVVGAVTDDNQTQAETPAEPETPSAPEVTVGGALTVLTETVTYGTNAPETSNENLILGTQTNEELNKDVAVHNSVFLPGHPVTGIAFPDLMDGVLQQVSALTGNSVENLETLLSEGDPETKVVVANLLLGETLRLSSLDPLERTEEQNAFIAWIEERLTNIRLEMATNTVLAWEEFNNEHYESHGFTGNVATLSGANVPPPDADDFEPVNTMGIYVDEGVANVSAVAGGTATGAIVGAVTAVAAASTTIAFSVTAGATVPILVLIGSAVQIEKIVEYEETSAAIYDNFEDAQQPFSIADFLDENQGGFADDAQQDLETLIGLIFLGNAGVNGPEFLLQPTYDYQ